MFTPCVDWRPVVIHDEIDNCVRNIVLDFCFPVLERLIFSKGNDCKSRMPPCTTDDLHVFSRYVIAFSDFLNGDDAYRTVKVKKYPIPSNTQAVLIFVVNQRFDVDAMRYLGKPVALAADFHVFLW